jgi:two-component system chemotaxis response regulator CheB
MPRMDGLTFLRRIMAERPTPVVICSSLAEKGAQVALDALAAGAVSIITKPKVGLKSFLDGAANDIIQAVKAAAHSRPGRRASAAVASLSPSPSLSADVILPAAHNASAPLGRTTDRLVAIGTSTGGTQALEAVLTALPVDTPGVVVVQHMPEKFTAMFAQRLNSLCKIEVREARSGDRVLPGLALIAPGGRHMMVKRNGAQYVVDVVDGPLVNRHKPSVDVLFRSVAKCAGHNALGIIMTGMGDDGARGLKEMRDAGAHTLAEDESTCVVFGMPKEAIRLGGAAEVLPLTRMAEGIGRFTRS